MYDILNPLHYVAANNPQEVNNVLRKYNLSVDNEDELFEAVDILAVEHGEKAVNEVMKCHPDKDALRYNLLAGKMTDPLTIKKDHAILGPLPGNGNGNGNGTTNIQDRWMLIALLLVAAFALGLYAGKSK